MIVDNFKIFYSWFSKLKNEHDFYFVQIIKRKKDGNENYPSSTVIKDYYFYSLDEFKSKENQIKELCKQYNARAYFWINPRNSVDIAFNCVEVFIKLYQYKNTNTGYKVWSQQCGQNPSKEYTKLWVVDIDTKDRELIEKYKSLILECRGKDRIRIYYEINTPHGIHLLTTGFDIKQLIEKEDENNLDRVGVQNKSDLTLLYYNACGSL